MNKLCSRSLGNVGTDSLFSICYINFYIFIKIELLVNLIRYQKL
jgi:hypothetical protein